MTPIFCWSLVLLQVLSVAGQPEEDASTNITCSVCTGAPDPTSCNSTAECKAGESCYVEEVLVPDGSITYNQGCMPQSFCRVSQQQSIGVGRRRRRQNGLTTCFRCCEDGDNCNAAFCRDNCASGPCLNNGTCTTTSSTNYTCTCPAGLQGEQCQEDVDECASSPCLYNGTCQDQINGFLCQCPQGRWGDLCELDACSSSPCYNNGTCQLAAGGAGGYECLCEAGYTGATCETEVDECASSPCQHGGSCTDLVGGFQCACGLKWSGEMCQEEKNGTVCLECADVAHPAQCRHYRLCPDQEDCYVDQHLAIDGSVSFTLGCRSHRMCDLYAQVAGQQAGRGLRRITVCSHCCREDYCNQEFCIAKQNGTACLDCISVENMEDCHNATMCGDGMKCYVADGLDLAKGRKSHQFGCQSDAVCRAIARTSRRSLLDSTFRAARRQDDKFLSSCVRCCDGNFCNKETCVRDFCASSPCANGGTCSNEKATFRCSCPPAFSGSTCNTSDPCFSKPCQNGGSCLADTGGQSFTCQCLQGTSGDRCQVANFCQPSPCKNNGLCSLAPDGSGPQCLCSTGFKGDHCDDVDHCFSSPCQHGGTCVDEGSAGFRCLCDSGFKGDTCQTVDYCSYSLCQNNGTCRQDAIGCFCTPDFVGQHCEISAKVLDWLCKNGGTADSNSTCICPQGFMGDTCKTPDPCSSFPCKNGGSCRTASSAAGYTCACLPGYRGALCQVAGQCTSSPCLHGGTCHEDRRGRVTCACAAGYSGKSCEVVDPCSSSPCRHNGTCASASGKAVCHCPKGTSGSLCKEMICSGRFPSLGDIACGKDIDLIFLLEESPGNGSHDDVRNQVAFMHRLLFSDSRAISGNTEAAILEYGASARVLTNLTNTFVTLQDALLAMQGRGGAGGGNGSRPSNLAQALDFARLHVQTRRHSQTVVVALLHRTDRPDQDNILAAAQRLKKDCGALNLVLVGRQASAGGPAAAKGGGGGGGGQQQTGHYDLPTLTQAAQLFGKATDRMKLVPSYNDLRYVTFRCKTP